MCQQKVVLRILCKRKRLDYKQDSVTEFPFYRCSSIAGEKRCVDGEPDLDKAGADAFVLVTTIFIHMEFKEDHEQYNVLSVV